MIGISAWGNNDNNNNNKANGQLATFHRLADLMGLEELSPSVAAVARGINHQVLLAF